MSRSFFAILWIAAQCLFCSAPTKNEHEFARRETVYVGGLQWAQPGDFNPLSTTPCWPVSNAIGENLFYETLFVMNTLTGRLEPLLAESLTIHEDHIDVRLQPSARFRDGSRVTAEDVEFSFNLGRQYPSLPVAALARFIETIEKRSITTNGSETGSAEEVSFRLKPDPRNALVVLDALQDTYILPKHVIAPLLEQAGSLNQFAQLRFEESVGSGPYALHSYNTEKVVAVRRDDYWGNEVFFQGRKSAVKYVVHPLFKNNGHFGLALRQGRLDAATTFIPRIWLKKRHGVEAWFDAPPFFPQSAIVVLWPNSQRAPLNDAAFRRALAFAIDYDEVAAIAFSGYTEPVKSGLILPFGLEGEYYSEEDADRYGATRHDPQRARDALTSIGLQAVWGPNGELLETQDASGRRIPTLYVTSPAGWTDWESCVRIIVRNLRAVGVDARERFIDGALYVPAAYNGDFDLLMAMPWGTALPSRPWSRMDGMLTTAEFKQEGEKAYKNWGRFNDPSKPGFDKRVQDLLDAIPTLVGPAKAAAYRELNALVMQYQPVIPIAYAPAQFYEFNEKVWQGFSTARDPRMPAQVPSVGMGTRALWSLRPSAETER